MLYLIDEYIEQYPYRKILELLRFKDCSKNLHEMTLDEVNTVVATWNAVIPSTAENTKRKIAQYLEWLGTQGVSIAFDIRKVKFPLKKSNADHAIYSTRDIQKYYDILYASIERNATKNGTNGSVSSLLRCHAAGILAFYGLSDEEILHLDLSDVQSYGVIGYDLPLTNDDIEILMRYKNLDRYDNNRNLKGTKYIRNANNDGVLENSSLNRPLIIACAEEEHSYVKTLLNTSQLNLFGKFDRAYNEEKKRGEKITMGGKTPQWFDDIFHLKVNWLTKRKKEYIAYRDTRDKKFSKDIVVERIAEINNSIAKLKQEAEELQKQLH